MFKNASKLAGLLLLLVLSFVYTDKVFSSARASDPVMKEVISYKKISDISPTEPIITDDEIILGYSGLAVNQKESYENMKVNDKFDKQKIVYDNVLPKTTISKTYDYYIKQGNPSKKEVAIIFKVDDSSKIDNLLRLVAKKMFQLLFLLMELGLKKTFQQRFQW